MKAHNLTNKWKIPLYKVLTDKEDIKLISTIIRRGMDWAIGPEIEYFEKSLSEYVGTKYCVTFNSGTSALHAALLSLGINSTHEVIVPSFSFIATANSVLMTGATPKFVDIEEKTYGLNPIATESVIERKSKAIIPVHYSGLPCDITELKEIAKRKKIFLIEDAAESIGAKINNRMVGTFGDMSIFSFAGNKVLTTGEGGCVVTNSKKYFQKLKLIRSHGRLDRQNYFSSIDQPKYVTLGYNWRISSITAAIGISQLEKIEKLIGLRRKNAAYMNSKLKNLHYISTPNEPTGFKHVYQLYSIRLPNSIIRNKMMQFLANKGIMTKVFFFPIHLTTLYKKMGYGKIPNLEITKTISNQILTLPMYPGLKKEEMNFICDSIHEFTDTMKL